MKKKPKLKKFGDGGKLPKSNATHYYTDNINDPKIKDYKDSLRNERVGLSELNLLLAFNKETGQKLIRHPFQQKIIPEFNNRYTQGFTKDPNTKEFKPIKNHVNNFPINIYTSSLSQNSEVPIFKHPTQQVIYQPKEKVKIEQSTIENSPNGIKVGKNNLKDITSKSFNKSTQYGINSDGTPRMGWDLTDSKEEPIRIKPLENSGYTQDNTGNKYYYDTDKYGERKFTNEPKYAMGGTMRKPRIRKYAIGGSAGDPYRKEDGTMDYNAKYNPDADQYIKTGTATVGAVTNVAAAYNNPNRTVQSEYDSTGNSISGVASSINPLVGAAIGLGHQIGKPIRQGLEKTNDDGSYKNKLNVKMGTLAGITDGGSSAITNISNGIWTPDQYANKTEEQNMANVKAQKEAQMNTYSKGGKHRPKLAHPTINNYPPNQMYGNAPQFQNGGKSAFNPNLALKDNNFQKWYKTNTLEGKNGIPFSDKLDYDYYSMYRNGDSGSIENHFPDKYKRPNHKTFSNESIYSIPENLGGTWDGDNFIPSKKEFPNGGVNLNLPDYKEKNPKLYQDNFDYLGTNYNDKGINYVRKNLDLGIGNYIPTKSINLDNEEHISSINPHLNLGYNKGNNYFSGEVGKDWFGLGYTRTFANGGMSNGVPNAEVESMENTLQPDGGTKQFDGPSHSEGGIPTQLEPNELIFSDRLKPIGSKKTFADLNRPNMTSKEEKILDDDKVSKAAKATAELMKSVKNKKSLELFNAQESLKQDKLKNYANRLGVDMNKFTNGGMYNDGIDMTNPSSVQDKQSYYNDENGNLRKYPNGGGYSTPEGTFDENGVKIAGAYGTFNEGDGYDFMKQVNYDKNNTYVLPSPGPRVDRPNTLDNIDYNPSDENRKTPSSFNWNNAADISAGLAQNAGNIWDLHRTNFGKTYDRENSGQLTSKLLDNTQALKNERENYLMNKKDINSISGGNSSVAMSNYIRNKSKSSMDRAGIIENFQNANTGIQNNDLYHNQATRMQDKQWEQQNKARSEDIASTAINRTGRNIAGTYGDYKTDKQNTQMSKYISNMFPQYKFDESKGWYFNSKGEPLNINK